LTSPRTEQASGGAAVDGGVVHHQYLDAGLAGVAREHLAQGAERGHDAILWRPTESYVEHLTSGS